MTEGYLWTEAMPEAKRVIEKGNNQSMELHEPTLQGFWSEDDKEGLSFFIINEALISKLCILGEDVEPCFEGAQITRVQFSFEEDFQKKLFNMMEQVKEMVKEGGTDSVEEEVKNPEMEEEKDNIEDKPEETPAEEPAADAEPAPEVEEPAEEGEKADEPADEEPAEESKDESVQYNLDNIQEYIELKSNYEELQTQFNAMKAEYDQLVEFKNTVDRAEKQRMVDSFYMLSDADKQDVVKNIDNYTVEQIEEKLSVICVRNKVSFDLNDKEDKVANEPATTFSLESSGIVDDTTPAWIKAVIDTKREME